MRIHYTVYIMPAYSLLCFKFTFSVGLLFSFKLGSFWQRTYSGGSQGRLSPSQNRKFASPAAASAALTPGNPDPCSFDTDPDPAF
jgi:hypothetical protein